MWSAGPDVGMSVITKSSVNTFMPKTHLVLQVGISVVGSNQSSCGTTRPAPLGDNFAVFEVDLLIHSINKLEERTSQLH